VSGVEKPIIFSINMKETICHILHLKVIFDPMGNLYIADINNLRIQFFHDWQSNGSTIARITSMLGINVTILYGLRSLRLDCQLNFGCQIETDIFPLKLSQ
jgi:hypothetical protein